MSRRPPFGLLGTLAGVAAAGVTVDLVNRRALRHRVAAIEEDVLFGSLHSSGPSVIADDGVRLHVEVDEPAAPHPDRPTVVFAHGWMVDLDSWHYQRATLRERGIRAVYYDQRSHGRSQRSPRSGCTLPQLGRDLGSVIEATTPTGPVVVVGHSMGGMTVMALAEQRPDLVRDRVVAAMLCGTSAGGLLKVGNPVRRAEPLLLAGAPVLAPLMTLARHLDLGAGGRRLAVGPDAPEKYAVMTEQMIARAHSHVVFDFLPNFGTLDAYAVLRNLPGEHTVVVGGTEDPLTPFRHSERIVDALPGARLVPCEGSGHMVMLEAHEQVDATLLGLVEEVA